MVVLVVGICTGALALVVLAILALDLWQRVARLGREVARAQERTSVALGELQRLTEAMAAQRDGSGQRDGSTQRDGAASSAVADEAASPARTARRA